MFLVTFHGGSSGKHHIYAYDDTGAKIGAYLKDATPSGTTGLRDIQFLPFAAGGKFYLVNSYKDSSEVFQIAPGAKVVAAPFVSGYGDKKGLGSVYHPFGIAFDSAMEVCYIANQDSNVVVRVNGPKAPNPGQPMEINGQLPPPAPGEAYLPGTFVASQVPLVPQGCGFKTPPSVTSASGGLAASPQNLKPSQTPANSVRGVAVIGTTLYVADEVDNCLRTYDTGTGEYQGTINDPDNMVISPTHLIVNKGQLYISVSPKKSNDQALVLCCTPPPNPTVSALIKNPIRKGINVPHPSGMTFDGNGFFYLADLDNKTVYQFDGSFQPTATQPFIPQGGTTMPDSPEFILWVNDEWLSS